MKAADWTDITHFDDLAGMDTPVHRLDARAKIAVTAAFIIAVMSFPPREISALMPFCLFPMAMAVLGRLPLRMLARGLLMALPFAAAVGIFNPLLDRTPVAIGGAFVTTGGWMSFASILFRCLLTVCAALALVACTGMHRLCSGMEQLGMPRVFAVQLLLLHRYMCVVADDGARLMRSVELRSGGRRRMRFGIYSSVAGNLFLRSADRAGRIYRAMVARNFDGDIRVFRRSSFRLADWCFMVGWIVYFAAARTWNLARMLGNTANGGMS